MANNKNTNNSTLVLIVAVILISVGLAAYHHIHSEHVQASRLAKQEAELEACFKQAGYYLQQANYYGQLANQYPLLPSNDGSESNAYLNDWTTAIQQCKQEY